MDITGLHELRPLLVHSVSLPLSPYCLLLLLSHSGPPYIGPSPQVLGHPKSPLSADNEDEDDNDMQRVVY